MTKALMIAGTQSGSGKTALALGLCAALVRRGLRVQPFKCGPDYLDPTYLEMACGRPCYNLDPWMCGAEYARRLFCAASNGGMSAPVADIALVEGVMGLYDGLHPEDDRNSSASVARLLDLPVLLVASAASMARSFAAAVGGFVVFPDAPEFAAIAANYCGSERHAEILKRAVESVPGLPPFAGAIKKGVFAEFESRHLGLVRANRNNLPHALLDQFAATVEESLDIDLLLKRAQNITATVAQHADLHFLQYPHATNSIPGALGVVGKKIRLGVAMDDALHFYYPDNLLALERSGFELVEFSPLYDASLPSGLDALYYGGGYPECYGLALSENIAMRDSLHAFVSGGGAVYGECGGLMYLSEGIELLDGQFFPMAGLLPVRVRMGKRLHALGYLDTTFTCNCPFGAAGEEIRGHEFHYSELAGAVPPEWRRAYSMRRARAPELPPQQEGFLSGKVFASYFHIHFANSANAIAAFRTFCTRR